LIRFEQEYTLRETSMRCGYQRGSAHAGVQSSACAGGAKEAIQRKVVDAHTSACLTAGIVIQHGAAEPALGQWSFQIGYKGTGNDPLTLSDHLWLARWLLFRLADDFNLGAPLAGGGNPSCCGLRAILSTRATRNLVTGLPDIERADHLVRNREPGPTNGDREPRISLYDDLSEIIGLSRAVPAVNQFRSNPGDLESRAVLKAAGAGSSPQRRATAISDSNRATASSDPYAVSARLLEIAANRERTRKRELSTYREFWKTGSQSFWQQPSSDVNEPFMGE